jgi:hypothetical protein
MFFEVLEFHECIMVKITNEDETMMTKLIATPFSVLASKKKIQDLTY